MFQKKDDKKAPEMEFTPGSGNTHKIPYKDRSIYVVHHEGKVLISGHDRQPTPQDKLTLMVWG